MMMDTQSYLARELAMKITPQNHHQQQQMMLSAMQSGAAAKVADNYTKEGAPYGPQFTEGGAVPHSLPDPVQDPGIPSGPTGGQAQG